MKSVKYQKSRKALEVAVEELRKKIFHWGEKNNKETAYWRRTLLGALYSLDDYPETLHSVLNTLSNTLNEWKKTLPEFPEYNDLNLEIALTLCKEKEFYEEFQKDKAGCC